MPDASRVTAGVDRRVGWGGGPGLAGILVVAAVLRVAPWLRPHVFLGVQEYDDGVYYGAARLLLHGQLPYRDVTIVHPPGAGLLMAPFAALGQLVGDPAGLAAARVLVVVVALANALLVARLASGWAGRRAGLVAAACYAVLPTAVGAEHTVLLEPFVTVCCLGAVVLLTEGDTARRRAAAGALLAAAVSIKLFGAAYLLAVVPWLVLRRRARDLLALGAGFVAGLTVLVLPFVLPAPGAFWHDVVVTQLSRPADATVSGVARAVDLVGLRPVSVPVGLLLLVALCGAGVHRWRAAPREQGPGARVGAGLWLAVLGISGLAFLLSASYFQHYGEFVAPAVAVLVAWALTGGQPGRWRSPLLGLTLAAFALGAVVGDLRTQGQSDLRRLGRSVPAGRCVFAETASLAIAADLLRPPSPACPGWVDGRGVIYTQSTGWPRGVSFYNAGFTSNARWQAAVVDQLSHASFLLLSRPAGSVPEWSATTRTYAVTHFRPVLVLPARGRGAAELWRRTG